MPKEIGTAAVVLVLIQLAIYAGIGYVVYALLNHFGIV